MSLMEMTAFFVYLVGGLERELYFFPYIGNVIIPIDFHIFRGVETTNQYTWLYLVMAVGQGLKTSQLSHQGPAKNALVIFGDEIFFS